MVILMEALCTALREAPVDLELRARDRARHRETQVTFMSP